MVLSVTALEPVAALELQILSLTPWWAELVVSGLKPLENRRWRPSKKRPLPIQFLIHASMGAPDDREQVLTFLSTAKRLSAEQVARARELVEGNVRRGGVVGCATIVDIVPPECAELMYDVTGAAPEWHMREQHGFVLRDIRRLPFVPWRGAQGMRRAPQALLEALKTAENTLREQTCTVLR